jgi:hypothetical protein
MKEVDMSDKAITARLKLVSQLRRLGLSLGKAKLVVKKEDGKQKPKSSGASRPDQKTK